MIGQALGDLDDRQFFGLAEVVRQSDRAWALGHPDGWSVTAIDAIAATVLSAFGVLAEPSSRAPAPRS